MNDPTENTQGDASSSSLRDTEPAPGQETLCGDTPWTAQLPGIRELSGRYVGAKEYARGGMGRILIAFDSIMAREVIIKELLPQKNAGAHGITQDLNAAMKSHPFMRRFLQEARITGSLEHPGIVPVYELGCREDGAPYYTMKVVRGKTLAQAIQEAASLRERLLLLPHFISLCQAIAYAHHRRVIHRDLKPANVMIGEFGETVVLDWGLARKLRDADAKEDAPCDHRDAETSSPDRGENETADGAVMGTPLYMSPEQARGDENDPDERSDVYSLGVILYEIITGHTPYSFSTLQEAVKKISQEPPLPVEMREPQAPKTLAAVCRRAMEKNPEKRYASAVDLAEEITRFLTGALVEAYDYRFSDHLRRFVSRRRWYLSAGAAMLVVVFAMTLASYVQIAGERDAATAARKQAETALAAEASARQDAETARQRATQTLYNAEIALASSHVKSGYYDRAGELLKACPVPYRNWEWGRLLFLCNQAYRSFPQRLASNLHAAQSGYMADVVHNQLVLEDASHKFSIVNGFTGRERICMESSVALDGQVCISPRGTWRLQRDHHRGTLHRMEDGEEVLSFNLINHWLWSFAFSADDSALAVRSSAEEICIHHLTGEKQSCRFNDTGLNMLQLSCDGAFAACLTAAGTQDDPNRLALVVRNAQDGEIIFRDDDRSWSAIAFAPDAPLLLAGGATGEAGAWHPESSQPAWQSQPLAAPIRGIAVSHSNQTARPEGPLVAMLAEEGAVWVGDSNTGGEVCRISASGKKAGTLAMSPDGKFLALSDDQFISLHDALSGRPIRRMEGHENEILWMAFSADGGVLYSATASDCKIWTITAPDAARPIPADRIESAALLSGSGLLRTVTAGGVYQDWRLDTGQAAAEPEPCPKASGHSIISPTGGQVLYESPDGLVLYDLAAARVLMELPRHVMLSTPAVFSPDGQWIAFLDADVIAQTAALLLHNARTGEKIAVLQWYCREQAWNLSSAALAFSPDGALLAASLKDRVVFYSVPEGYEKGFQSIPEQQDKRPNVSCFNRTGNRMALSLNENQLLLFNPLQEDPARVVSDVSRMVTALAFSPDGSRLAVGDDAGVITIRDACSGIELSNERLFQRPVRLLSFSDDDQTLLAGDGVQAFLLRGFPWRDADLPGTACDLLADRITALKSYHPRMAPAWGFCQQQMHALEDQLLALDGAVDANAAWADALTCPEKGRYSFSNAGAPICCSLHGPLENPAHLLARIRQFENPSGSNADAVRKSLMQALPQTPAALAALAESWTFQQPCHRAIALLACEKGLELQPDSAPLQTAKLMLLLQGDAPETALDGCRDLPLSLKSDPKILPQLTLALAQRGHPEDIREACEILCDRWRKEPRDEKVNAALALLRQSPGWKEEPKARAVEEMMAWHPEDWKQLPWRSSLEEALEEAKAADKIVFLNLTVSDSSAMRFLLEEVYGHPGIKKRLTKYYSLVMINAEEHPEMKEKYGVTMLPALLFLDKNGMLLRRANSIYSFEYFVESFLTGFESEGQLRQWRIIGPFEKEGCRSMETDLWTSEINKTPEHAGKTGPVSWHAYALPPVFSRVALSHFFADTGNCSYYAYTCFTTGEDELIQPKLLLSEEGKAWLDGENISKFVQSFPGTGSAHDAFVLKKGPHALLLKVAGRWDVNFSVAIQRSDGSALHHLHETDLPAAPPLSLRNPLQEQEARRQAVNDTDLPNTRHLTIQKEQILREWRENYGEILATLNPQPLFENGAISGIRVENPESIAILAASGFKNGDVIVSINGHAFGGDKSIFEIAELTEGSNLYIIKILRNKEEHTFYVHVQ